MAWRVAYSLNRLLDQLNALAPDRNKASDGSIGDTSHQNRNSDHNPWYPPPDGGIVTARDFTHDPAKLNMQWVADTLVAHRDPRIKYIIWNRRILSGNPGPSPWVWRAYTGPNPHDHHLHLSVVASPACDSTAAWAGFIRQQPPEDDMALTDPMRPYFSAPGTNWPESVKAMDVGATLANIFSLAGAAQRDAAAANARAAAIEGKLTDNQAVLLAAIADDDVQVDLTTEQMQLLLNGMTAASVQGLRELLGSLDNG